MPNIDSNIHDHNASSETQNSPSLKDAQTISHALAVTSHDQKGAVQHASGQEIKDLGWNAPQESVPSPLIGGMDNEYLWMLVRRFNKQTYHVKEITTPVPGSLDLNIADQDDFSPDKLRSTIERLYMAVGIDLISFGKHVVRIRSWHEQRRTATLCGVYFIAWAFDVLFPVLASLVIALILFPDVRDRVFPPAPLALVSASTGGLQKPPAGVLGSADSVTGAPEQYQGEAVEQEANNFVNNIAHVALSSASGKHPADEVEADEDSPDKRTPDPTELAIGASNARSSTQGNSPSEHRDKTKQPMEAAMWNKMRPIMHALQDVADTWERFANALSPTAPFPKDARIRLASLVLPLLAISFVVTSYVSMKALTLGVGFGFFGDPLMRRAIHLLNEKIPNWQKMLDLRNTVLKGVPTNAQLTITLLRIGEAKKAPLPPPPQTSTPPPNQPTRITNEKLNSGGADAPLGASDEEIQAAVSHDPSSVIQVESPDVAASKTKTHGKTGSRVLNFFKSGVRGSVATAIGADRMKAVSGNTAAKNRLGVLSRPGSDFINGPVDFKSRFHGNKGHTFISTDNEVPSVSFTTDSTVEKVGTRNRSDLHPVWTVNITDIKELKKVGGYGWKTRLVVGWAMSREIADGLEITTRKGEVWKLTALPLRDELFNRLIAIGGQKWESW